MLDLKNFGGVTWPYRVLKALRAYGGEARLPDLYKWFKKNEGADLTPHFDSSIRATLQAFCAESKRYVPNNLDLFRNTARGWWAIRRIDNPRSIQLSPNVLNTLVFLKLSKELGADEIKAIFEGSEKTAFWAEQVERLKADLLNGKNRAV